jgi:hypothetical protein
MFICICLQFYFYVRTIGFFFVEKLICILSLFFNLFSLCYNGLGVISWLDPAGVGGRRRGEIFILSYEKPDSADIKLKSQDNINEYL